jgi:flagellar FliL protein
MASGAMAARAEDEEELPAEGEAAEGASRKKWSGKRLVLVAGIPLLLILIGAGVYFSGLLGSSKKAEAPASKVEQGPAVYVDLPEILVNLEATGKQQRFLKASISLEVANAADAEALKKQMPRLIDQFQTYLRGLRVDDLHGSSGVYRLRQELLARVAQSAEPTPVDDVLFRELLVQ